MADIDAHRDEYRVMAWDMEPGDVLVFHPLLVHGSQGRPARPELRGARRPRGRQLTSAVVAWTPV